MYNTTENTIYKQQHSNTIVQKASYKIHLTDSIVQIISRQQRHSYIINIVFTTSYKQHHTNNNAQNTCSNFIQIDFELSSKKYFSVFRKQFELFSERYLEMMLRNTSLTIFDNNCDETNSIQTTSHKTTSHTQYHTSNIIEAPSYKHVQLHSNNFIQTASYKQHNTSRMLQTVSNKIYQCYANSILQTATYERHQTNNVIQATSYKQHHTSNIIQTLI